MKNPGQQIEVVFIHRKPRSHGNFSIEFLFKDIRSRLPKVIDSKVRMSKYESSGVWKRLYNVVEAALWKGDVKHITGDVHYLAFLLRGKKSVLTIHDCYTLYMAGGLWKKILQKFWFEIPVRRCRSVVAISEATKQEIIKFTGCPPEKISIIPVFISEQYQAFPKNFNKEKPVLLHVGLAPNKNLDRLAEAIEGISCHLSIIGKLNDGQKAKLEKHSIEYSFAYNISDEEVLRKYQECDILTFVSTYEGFGMPIIEANAVGRPVLTSNLSSMPEVAGDAACLVDPYDAQSIRAGLLKIIHDDEYRNRLIDKGFKNCHRFNPQDVANRYCQLYMRLAGRASELEKTTPAKVSFTPLASQPLTPHL
jgi:glycosyltransferase involved in cell wall biosynthesis